MEDQKRTKQDYYLAQIAAEVRRGQVKHPRQVKLSDFLMRETDPVQDDLAKKSKQAWLAAVGLQRKKS